MSYQIKNIQKSFAQLNVLADISMNIPQNKVVTILGPSGCGKTTLLNIFSGVLAPDSGTVDGFEQKTISYLFQEPRLLRWKTVAQNIDFVLEDKLDQADKEQIINKYLQIVGLAEYQDYYPDDLSGGMKQRVAIARAFAYPSEIMLLDEPFKSLDLELKMNLIQCFLTVWGMDKRTVVFVTHDIHAAVLLGDEIYVLSQKPTVVQQHLSNNVPYQERTLRHSEILLLEEQLYAAIAKTSQI